MTQLHTYVEGRLRRWAIWFHAGERPGPKRVISFWGPMILNRNVEQTNRPRTVSVDPTEAELTNRCVYALPRELLDVVLEVYTKGGTVEQKARALGCCRKTVYDRLDRVNIKLLGYFNDVEAGIALPAPDRQKNNLHELHKLSIFAAKVA
jgi:DNA-directed RNA polymerase specialized sigma24 family protein